MHDVRENSAELFLSFFSLTRYIELIEAVQNRNVMNRNVRYALVLRYLRVCSFYC